MDQIYKQAVALQQKFRDYIDDRSHPLAGQLDREIQGLEDDVQVKKHPKTIEDRAKRIISLLSSVDGTPVMDGGHADDLKDRAQDIINELRQL